MSGFFSPNLKILADWRETFTSAFQELRRFPFATQNTFAWSNFNPQTNWRGMTTTLITISRTRYMLVNKILYFSLDISATLAAPLTNSVLITLPESLLAPGQAITPNAQAGATALLDGGILYTGKWILYDGLNVIALQSATGANFAAGSFRCVTNGFIEVA